MPAVYWILLSGSCDSVKSRSFECIADNSNGFTHQLLLRVTPGQCHLHSGSLPGTAMCHFANAHMRSLHFKLRKAESLENGNQNYSPKKKCLRSGLYMAGLYEVAAGWKLALKLHVAGRMFYLNTNEQTSPPHKQNNPLALSGVPQRMRVQWCLWPLSVCSTLCSALSAPPLLQPALLGWAALTEPAAAGSGISSSASLCRKSCFFLLSG